VSDTEFDEGPWYKQFWLWFMLVPLGVLMTGSFYLLYVSIVTNDGVVVDNYYRDGKGYVVRREEDAFARAMDLSAKVFWSDETISVKLNGDLTPPPETLELMVIFPTAQQFDVYIDLQHRGLGEYVGKLPEPVSGRRMLQLHPIGTDIEWRLHADITLPPQDAEIILNPKQE
jgi:hypothetical protein